MKREKREREKKGKVFFFHFLLKFFIYNLPLSFVFLLFVVVFVICCIVLSLFIIIGKRGKLFRYCIKEEKRKRSTLNLIFLLLLSLSLLKKSNMRGTVKSTRHRRMNAFKGRARAQ
jgi:hypothetical protein